MAIKKKSPETVIRGKLNFCKLLGMPRENYGKDGFEWTVDLYDFGKETITELKKLGIGDRIKVKDEYLDGNPHLSLRQKYRNVDPDSRVRNGPDDELDPDIAAKQRAKMAIVDKKGNLWPTEDLIGNGTVADVKLRIVDYGKGKKKGVYIQGVRILDHVPYVPKVFDELDEDDEYYEEYEGDEDVDLDDSVDDIGEDEEV